MRSKQYILSAGLLGCSIWGLGSCNGASESKESHLSDSTKVEVARQIEVSSVVRDSMEITLEYSSTLKALVTNAISTQTGGRLHRLSVREGDRVSAGQILGQLDQFTLNQSKIQLDDAKVNYNRINELYKVGGVSAAQWEQASSAMRIAEEAYRNLQSNTFLRSPISGVVTAKNYNVGDMTSPGQPILVVEQIAPIKALVQVPEEYYVHLQRGLPSSIVVDALGGRSFQGRISNIFPTIDPATHTVTVEVESTNRDQVLRPGMFGRITLHIGQKEALLLPDRAVMRQVGSGERYVYVFRDGRAERRVVELGALYGDRYEVVSGVDAGEAVITSSPSTITNGMLVTLGSAE